MKRGFGGNLLKFLFFLGCIYGILRASIWSYFQTQLFFVPFDAGDLTHIVSHSLSLISQYGQNVVLFLAAIEAGRRLAYKNKISTIPGNKIHVSILQEEINKSQTLSNIYYVLFGSFALIDSGTNLGQFYAVTYVEAQKTLTGTALFTFAAVGSLISVVVVFVEEMFMATANALLHAFNDVLESLGKNRIKSFDLFIDPDKILATRLEERSGKRDGSGEQPQVRPSSSIKYPDNLPRQSSNNSNNNGQGKGDGSSQISTQFRPAPKPVSQSRNLQEPTYHPISYQNMNEKEQEGFDA